MIRQPHKAAGELRHDFEIDFSLRLLAADVLETETTPRTSNPFARIIVASHPTNMVVPTQLSILLRHLLRIKPTSSAAHHIDHAKLALLVSDRDGVSVATSSTTGR